jgi:AcrR family transcriptional regulator
VHAAAALFAERGYGGTTADAVAQAAGVSRKTVFTSVGGKAELIKLAYDFAIAGDDEPVPMPERPGIRALVAEDDAARMLAAYAAMVADIGARIAPVYDKLVRQRGWPVAQFRDWLAAALQAQLLGYA